MVEGLAEGLSHAPVEEQPPIGDDEPGRTTSSTGGRNSGRKAAPMRPDVALGDDPEAVTKGQERVLCAPAGGLVPSAAVDDRLGSEFLVEEKANVVGFQAPLDPITDYCRDLVEIPLAVHGLQEFEQQRRELQDLAVRAAHQ